jgi:hypothetical protein
MRDYIEAACDEIDAAVFSGNAFDDLEGIGNRQELREYMARWERALKEKERP